MTLAKITKMAGLVKINKDLAVNPKYIIRLVKIRDNMPTLSADATEIFFGSFFIGTSVDMETVAEKINKTLEAS